MWACIKGCVSENLAGISTWAIIAIVVAIVALFAGTLTTGGAAAPLMAALPGIIGPYIVAGGAAALTAILSGLVGCILRCLI